MALSSSGGTEAHNEMYAGDNGEQEEEFLNNSNLANVKSSFVKKPINNACPSSHLQSDGRTETLGEKSIEVLGDAMERSEGSLYKTPPCLCCKLMTTDRPRFPVGCISPTPLSSDRVCVELHPHYIQPFSSLITSSTEPLSNRSLSTQMPMNLDPKAAGDSKAGYSTLPFADPTLPYYLLSPTAVGSMRQSLGWIIPQQGHPSFLCRGTRPDSPYSTLQTINTYMPSFLPQMVPAPLRSSYPTGIPHSSMLKQDRCWDVDFNSKHDLNDEEKKGRIKKPLNAFMLYMKAMRAEVVSECTLKESAAINQVLGRKWHALSREEQGKYYELARKERQMHIQLYPGWSARDNYGKRKKRKMEKPTLNLPREGRSSGTLYSQDTCSRCASAASPVADSSTTDAAILDEQQASTSVLCPSTWE